jgi:hypothetical protein
MSSWYICPELLFGLPPAYSSLLHPVAPLLFFRSFEEESTEELEYQSAEHYEAK